ncbi:MAG: HlyC/CorC family transporter [Calditrichaeota bacterium]|nr:MAG: HlyC/CorC family transporter [Calditrichota bacterium]
MTILIIVVIVTLLVSASCSLYEAVLYSTRPATLEAAKKQTKRGKLASQFIALKKNISKPIAAILILNTLANTAGATMAGMYATNVLGPYMVPVFSIIFTLAILFLSEIIPKTVGAVHWRALWPFIVYPLKVMQTALYPAILVTERLSRLLTSQQRVATITEEEILALVHLGAHEGEITKEESRMVRNIINLEERQIREIMTPRRMIFSLPATMTIEEAILTISGKGVTRIPIYENDRENIVGYVVSHDIGNVKMQKESTDTLQSIARPISFVAETMNCLTILISFLKHRKHIAIVSDEFGGVDGLVTMEDLLETLLGSEIVDETDRVVDLQEAARKGKSENRTNDEEAE